MVANGHAWSSIKKYTLAEIGVFFKTIVLLERGKKAQNLSELWQGNNLTFDGLKDALKELGINTAKQVQQPTKAEVNKDWTRLATFMSGRT